MSRKLTWTLIVILATWAFALFYLLKKPSPNVIRNASVTFEPSKPDLPIATPVAATPKVDRSHGYIGSDSCRQCHQEHHQSWHESYHRTMTQMVGPESVPESIVDGGRIEFLDEDYVFTREGDEYFVELNDPIANGKRVKRKLVLMTGSHHMQVFWYESGYDQTPAQLQIMYYIDGGRWIPRRSAFLRHPNMHKDYELGRWNGICSNCHATQTRTRPPESGEINWETSIAEYGITCEACHGPGEEHVKLHQPSDSSPLNNEVARQDDPIVNPSELPKDLKSDLCGQCHGMMMISIADAKDKETYFSSGRQFRPGDQLEDAPFLRLVRASKDFKESESFRLFDAHPGVTENHFWPDGQMRVTGRDYSGMIESPCYQRGELGCVSCHTMHQQDESLQAEWKDDQLKPQMRTDDACLQCHPSYADLGESHTHHPVGSEGSRCMNCHMPHTVYGILKSSRSHTISSPSVATTLQTGRPNACNLCHLDFTLQQTAKHLHEWYGHDIPELSDDQKNTADSLLHFITGDAAQRALQVNAFQWPPAQKASGTGWMPLFFLLGMDDEYHAIRLISERGFNLLPDVEPFTYNFLDSLESRGATMGRQYQKALSKEHQVDGRLLIDSSGYFDRRRMERLMEQRDERPIYLQE
ncbi:cytochrome c3 family protein [Stieleria sp. JC731]|uniref:cytochrome c3 family protein n=1 Tax=Pirellulaceae TaxID=2691357 RepID=UPI001E55CD35|nr:cytochrome c3 family protein [Stieleria sp. JC731]MCC9601307.1 cytochrome c3 family protein [Stieleria sp. JC731]